MRRMVGTQVGVGSIEVLLDGLVLAAYRQDNEVTHLIRSERELHGG